MTRGAEKERSTIGSQPPTPVGFTVGDVTQRALRRWVPFVNAGYPALQVRAAMPQPALRVAGDRCHAGRNRHLIVGNGPMRNGI